MNALLFMEVKTGIKLVLGHPGLVIRKETKMKCCTCDKEIDITNNKVVDEEHAEWYGNYHDGGTEPGRVICYGCIQDPVKREKYIKGE